MNVELILHNLFRYNIIPRSFNEMSETDRIWILQVFRDQYYANATPSTHLCYLTTICHFFHQSGRLPTSSEFFLRTRRLCFCEHYVDDDDYVRAASFFMRMTGDVLGIPCHYFYYHSEFYEIEQRDPANQEELERYVQGMMMINTSPSHMFDFFGQGQSESPLSPRVLQRLRESVREITGEECCICQEEIVRQPGIKLGCGHFFHAESANCCETGTIFTWAASQRSCPMCRSALESEEKEDHGK